MAIPSEAGLSLNNIDFKIVIVLHGAAYLRLDNLRPFQLKRGDVVIMPQVCKQHYSCTDSKGRTTHLHVMLLRWNPNMLRAKSRDGFSEYLSKTLQKPMHLEAASCASLLPFVYKLRQVMQMRQGSAPALLELSRLMVLEIAQALAIHTPPLLPAQWQEAERDYLELTRDPLMPQQCRSKNFKVWEGGSPVQYRSLLRVEMVKELMAYQMQPLATLARQVGFRSQSSFSHTFRRIVGCNPREYLQRLGQPLPSRSIPIREIGSLADPFCIEASDTLWQASSPSIIVTTGSITQIRRRGGDITFTADSQELIYAPPGTCWKQGAGGQSAVLALQDVPRGISRGGKMAKRIPLPERRLIEHLRCHLQVDSASSSSAHHHQLYANSLFKLIVSEWVNGGAPGGAAAPAKSRPVYRLPVDYATEYLRKNLSRPVTLADVAWFAGVSEEHLSRSFKRIYKVTLMEYLKQIRLEHAKVSLVTSDRTVTDISDSCGFTTAAHFCREFKSATGQTPTNYRKHYKDPSEQ